MRKSLLLALALTSSATFAQDYWCLNRTVSIGAEYTYLRRQELRDLRLAEEVPAFEFLNQDLKGKKVLDTDDLEERLGWESGIRGNVTLYGGECTSYEFLYTYISPWTASSTVHAKEGTVLRYPFNDHTISVGLNRADRVEAFYKSRLQTGEANFWWHVTPQRVDYFSFSWNLGLRIMWLREDFQLDFINTITKATYGNETSNILYGPQLGAVLEMNPDACWTWTFMIKGAGFLNSAENDLEITDENGMATIEKYNKQTWTDSWLIEGYGQLAYHFGPHFSIHFGYQGYILTGVALAPAQRETHVHFHRDINVKGQILIDGLYTGLAFSF